MRTPSRHAATLVDLVALGLIASGPVMMLRGRAGMAELRAELERQRIDFPPHDRELPAGLSGLAGRRVRSGADARAYSELIKEHLEEATGGRSYAELSAELQAGEPDEKLNALRQTAFMGESLRAGLLGAYQASNIALLVVGVGALFTGVGASLLALAHGGRSSHNG